MMPCADFVRIASLEHDTTAANRRCASRASASVALPPVALTARLGPPNVLERCRTRRDGAIRGVEPVGGAALLTAPRSAIRFGGVGEQGEPSAGARGGGADRVVM